MCLCVDEFTVKKIVCKEFAKVQFSQCLFMVGPTREREREKKKAVVRCLPRCYFLTVSLYCTLRTINVNYLLYF